MSVAQGFFHGVLWPQTRQCDSFTNRTMSVTKCNLLCQSKVAQSHKESFFSNFEAPSPAQVIFSIEPKVGLPYHDKTN